MYRFYSFRDILATFLITTFMIGGVIYYFTRDFGLSAALGFISGLFGCVLFDYDNTIHGHT